MDNFNSLYKRLNPQQKKAVDFIEGPVMVVAGPGTGKTRVLTLRIANILRKTDISPENILSLTFTESGVFSIRSKLIEIIGSDGYMAKISTFHSFCNSLIKDNIEYFPKIGNSRSISQGEQAKILASIISKGSFEILKPHNSTLFYLRSIISSIDKLKREGIDWKEFKDIARKEEEKKKREKNTELSLIYEAYQKKMEKLKLYDYNDMIIESLRGISKEEELLSLLQEKYQYILIDEHQDTNNAQNKIIEIILKFHKNPNIFIVGDEKQAIYRFQGASSNNFNYFQKIYPEIKIISLKENYRSTKEIISLAEEIIPSPLVSEKKEKGKTNLFSFKSKEEESSFIAKDIKKKIKEVRPSEIAIICRDNKDIFSIAPFLEKEKIPISIASEEDITEDVDIEKILSILKAINSPEEKEIMRAMHVDFLNISPLDIFKIIREKKLPQLLKGNFDIDLLSKGKIKEFLNKTFQLFTLSRNEKFFPFLEKALDEFNFSEYIMKKGDLKKIEKIRNFLNECRRHEGSLEEFLEHLEVLKSCKIPIKKSVKDYLKGVSLITAHKSKGLEFSRLYITRSFFGHWGDRRNVDLLPLPPSIFSISGEKIEESDKNEDERKLFYVSITRAKKELTISYPLFNEEGRELLPARFLKEINSLNEEKKEVEESLFISPSLPKKEFKNKNFIKELFKERGLSATGINNYLRCPIAYFYNNLIKFPMPYTKSQAYGTAIHETLKIFFNSPKGKDFLLSTFLKEIEKMPISNQDIERLKRRGKKSLSGYYERYNKEWNKNLLLEFYLKVPFKKTILQGKIDKIERLGGREVNVVDYKTGKIKTRGQIEGKTKDSNGDIKRQLVFYNLLLNNYKKYKMISGEIDFVEPNEKGYYKKEIFRIEKEELEDLKETIIRISEEILSLSFWGKGCKKKDCFFCSMLNLKE